MSELPETEDMAATCWRNPSRCNASSTAAEKFAALLPPPDMATPTNTPFGKTEADSFSVGRCVRSESGLVWPHVKPAQLMELVAVVGSGSFAQVPCLKGTKVHALSRPIIASEPTSRHSGKKRRSKDCIHFQSGTRTPQTTLRAKMSDNYSEFSLGPPSAASSNGICG